MQKAVGPLSLELTGATFGLELRTGNVSAVGSQVWTSPGRGGCLGPRPEAKLLLSCTNTSLSSWAAGDSVLVRFYRYKMRSRKGKGKETEWGTALPARVQLPVAPRVSTCIAFCSLANVKQNLPHFTVKSQHLHT